MVIKGTVENLIFRNAENGYTVAEIDCGGNLVVAVGIMPHIAEGEMLELTGDFRYNERFSTEQFMASEVKIGTPEELYDIARFLSSGLIKGVGDVTAQNIVNVFGKATLDVIEKDPLRLASVKGVSEKKAMEISEQYVNLRKMQESIMFLQKLGLSVNMAVKIYQFYSDDIRELITKNPYILVEDIEGVGFQTADRLAKKLGIEINSDFRIRAGVFYTLKENSAKNGNIYLPYRLFAQNLAKLLGLAETDLSRIDEVTGKLAGERRICVFELEGEDIVALSENYYMEKKLAGNLMRIEQSFSPLTADVDYDIEEFEKLNAIKLHDMQKFAVKTAAERGVVVITGGPGTGKTTIIKCILYILQKKGSRVVMCAPTGRAAKRMSEATDYEAKTIHRLLDLDYTGGRGYFTYNEDTRLNCDAVIVDEVSMVDSFLMKSLTNAVKNGARLILTGDKDQLPSVGAGNVLADIIGSGCFDVVHLTEVYRQAAESLIITNAHRINSGEMPVLNVKDNDFFFDRKSDPAEILETVTDMVVTRIPRYLGVASDKIQVLAPMKKGMLGVNNLNSRLQEILNPFVYGKPEIISEERIFRLGDKVMQIANNYQAEWVRGDERGTGVFNGDIGRITAIDKQTSRITVTFEDDRICTFSAAETDDLALAYAISIHKSQGCEFDAVVLPVTGGNFMLHTRNLLYTAVTRAKKMAVLIGLKENIAKMVENNYTAKRYSLLKYFLKTYSEENTDLPRGLC